MYKSINKAKHTSTMIKYIRFRYSRSDTNRQIPPGRRNTTEMGIVAELDAVTLLPSMIFLAYFSRLSNTYVKTLMRPNVRRSGTGIMNPNNETWQYLLKVSTARPSTSTISSGPKTGIYSVRSSDQFHREPRGGWSSRGECLNI